ncbi:protein of unknown function [Pseudorhizobium banfieldiae]|uniref:Uncharacterized protein n=1 Tax=Pseudorhizobium banfieldiae TaxID=1125847 RepID=L0NNI6_9HYPH|nr:protein of unknown function [Pseudorhizobium banfieldiae]
MTPRRDKAQSAGAAKPGPVRRLANRRFGKSAAGRIGTAAVLAALGALVRNHPLIAMEMAAAGLKKAGKVGVTEFKDLLSPVEEGSTRQGDAPGRPV